VDLAMILVIKSMKLQGPALGSFGLTSQAQLATETGPTCKRKAFGVMS